MFSFSFSFSRSNLLHKRYLKKLGNHTNNEIAKIQDCDAAFKVAWRECVLIIESKENSRMAEAATAENRTVQNANMVSNATTPAATTKRSKKKYTASSKCASMETPAATANQRHEMKQNVDSATKPAVIQKKMKSRIVAGGAAYASTESLAAISTATKTKENVDPKRNVASHAAEKIAATMKKSKEENATFASCASTELAVATANRRHEKKQNVGSAAVAIMAKSKKTVDVATTCTPTEPLAAIAIKTKTNVNPRRNVDSAASKITSTSTKKLMNKITYLDTCASKKLPSATANRRQEKQQNVDSATAPEVIQIKINSKVITVDATFASTEPLAATSTAIKTKENVDAKRNVDSAAAGINAAFTKQSKEENAALDSYVSKEPLATTANRRHEKKPKVNSAAAAPSKITKKSKKTVDLADTYASASSEERGATTKKTEKQNTASSSCVSKEPPATTANRRQKKKQNVAAPTVIQKKNQSKIVALDATSGSAEPLAAISTAKSIKTKEKGDSKRNVDSAAADKIAATTKQLKEENAALGSCVSKEPLATTANRCQEIKLKEDSAAAAPATIMKKSKKTIDLAANYALASSEERGAATKKTEKQNAASATYASTRSTTGTAEKIKKSVVSTKQKIGPTSRQLRD